MVLFGRTSAKRWFFLSEQNVIRSSWVRGGAGGGVGGASDVLNHTVHTTCNNMDNMVLSLFNLLYEMYNETLTLINQVIPMFFTLIYM